MDTLFEQLEKELQANANPEKSEVSQNFFKTGPGQYGEHDIFLGITVPELRKMARTYELLNFESIEQLLYSPIHEERLLALLILVKKYQNMQNNEKNREKIYFFLKKHIKQVNNWDLVDLTVYHIIGHYLNDKPKEQLYKWAKSKNLWLRRIAIISTFHYLRQNKFEESLKIADMLLHDDEDLIQKAVGWVIREIGKRDLAIEEKFLKKRYQSMPRTMLRYAIEKFEEKKRQAYLKNEI